jgi:heme-degrading monooxygenase HmoA
MFWEVAQIDVNPGSEAAFEAAAVAGVPLFERARGCKSMELYRLVEQPSRYRLVVGWETLEDHTVHFRGSEDFQEWRRLLKGLFVGAPVVDHMQSVLKGV